MEQTTLTLSQMRALRSKLDAVVKQFAEENELNVTPSSIKYSDTEFEVRMRFSTKASNPSNIDPRYKSDLITRGKKHGLFVEMIGTKYKGASDVMEFLGMRATKVVSRNSAGELFVTDAESVSRRIISAYENH